MSPTKEPKERRQSWWRGMQARMSPLGSYSTSNSSSHNNKRNEYSHAAERKVEKRRRNKQLESTRRTSHEGSDSEGGEMAEKTHKLGTTTRKASNNQNNTQMNTIAAAATATPPLPSAQDKPHWMYTFFQFLNNHPTLPHILSFWAQLMLNLFLIASIMYVLWSFWATIRADVDKKSSEAVAELMAEMAVCAQQYTANRCVRAERVPAMETVCENWERCMNQDPRNVGRARVSAHTFAEIFNGFIEPISYKAMVSFLSLLPPFPFPFPLSPFFSSSIILSQY